MTASMSVYTGRGRCDALKYHIIDSAATVEENTEHSNYGANEP